MSDISVRNKMLEMLDEIEKQAARITELEAENANLKELFVKYARHTRTCVGNFVFHDGECDCGYDQARAALGGAK